METINPGIEMEDVTDMVQVNERLLVSSDNTVRVYNMDVRTFDVNSSLMAATYNKNYSGGYSGTVPSGWLVPFSWVKIGRGNAEGERIAHVRLVVPHTYGTTAASGSVYACLYDLTLQRGR